MRVVKVKDIKDGMVLAEPLTSSVGVVLMGEGTVLRQSFAPRLAQRGIDTVCIEGEPDSEDIVEEHVSGAQKMPLEALFEKKLVNNSMKTIYEALVRHRKSNGT